MAGLDQTVLNVELRALAIKDMLARGLSILGREAIGELATVVG
ncbi:hypothetical protein NB231_06641 [Nitrococcus mobilis Nb-231]|uniref:Uncharacterized protein n=1 Tax=Nitrococcus mobilis Nb-231 TaxID=314278 RepID=A4BR45_9GAMM|nr:hypothetical protein NB231_06641 [Nitrococcus mobilis Nb-231]